jgi:hypothetical protein
MDDYKNPHQENVTFSPEDLTITFFASIENDYLAQMEFVERFASALNPVVMPVCISIDGVTLLTQFNAAMQSALPSLLEAMKVIAGADVEYGLMDDDWRDVTYDFDLGTYRLMNEEELDQLYGHDDEEPTPYI